MGNLQIDLFLTTTIYFSNHFSILNKLGLVLIIKAFFVCLFWDSPQQKTINAQTINNPVRDVLFVTLYARLTGRAGTAGSAGLLSCILSPVWDGLLDAVYRWGRPIRDCLFISAFHRTCPAEETGLHPVLQIDCTYGTFKFCDILWNLATNFKFAYYF